ncbi:MAG: HAD-IB family hydrolase [Candidatus Competibacteraceae bacterium]|jgi:HAD superfamily hydrolase (TIGR01490 family)|nr:HAD-IB family hydrolase [Candidatus Competibacteraceae bacterium]
MRLALFDVDGTLIHGSSAELEFMKYLLRHRKIGLLQGLAWLYFMCRWLPCYGTLIGKKNKAYLTAMKQAEVRHIAKEFVVDVLPRKIHAGALARLQVHLRAGEPVVLLTGTPDFIAAPFAELLGATDFRASHYATQRGRFVAAPPLSHPYGPEKLRIARELCVSYNLSMQDVVAYADHHSDVKLLQSVGHPVVVSADRVLRATAQDNGWEMLDCNP